MADGFGVPGNPATGAVGEAAASDAILADDRGQAGEGASGLAAVAVALDTVGELEQGGFGGAVAAGEGDDRLGGHAGDRGDALRRVLASALAQVFPTKGVGAEPGFVMEPFGEEDVHQAQGKGAVGGGSGANMFVGAAGGEGATRVDDDDVGAVALR